MFAGSDGLDGSMGSKSDVNAYANAIRNYNPEDYVETESLKPFDWESEHSKEDYLNPYYSRIIGDTANSIQHSAAGAGIGRTRNGLSGAYFQL